MEIELNKRTKMEVNQTGAEVLLIPIRTHFFYFQEIQAFLSQYVNACFVS